MTAGQDEPGVGELTVGYSTLAGRVAGLRPVADARVRTVVVVQDPATDQPGEAPRIAGADSVVTMPGGGVARSRNRAIDLCETRYLLFGDDDVEIDVDAVLEAVALLRETGAAIALGYGIDMETGVSRKRHPDRVTRLTALNCGRAATYEMVIDVAQCRSAGVTFDTRFGAGAVLPLGDEYLFIVDAVRAGLTGYSVPLAFGRHPHDSSGSDWDKPAHLVSRAAVLERAFGRWAPLARAAFAARHVRRVGGIGGAWRFAVTRPALPPRAAE